MRFPQQFGAIDKANGNHERMKTCRICLRRLRKVIEKAVSKDRNVGIHLAHAIVGQNPAGIDCNRL